MKASINGDAYPVQYYSITAIYIFAVSHILATADHWHKRKFGRSELKLGRLSYLK